MRSVACLAVWLLYRARIATMHFKASYQAKSMMITRTGRIRHEQRGRRHHNDKGEKDSP